MALTGTITDAKPRVKCDKCDSLIEPVAVDAVEGAAVSIGIACDCTTFIEGGSPGHWARVDVSGDE